MEHFHALLLTFLEMTFIFVGLGLLYSQRRTIGNAPFYMSLGLLLLFSHLISAAEIRTALVGSFDFEVGRIVVFLPILAAYLMVYITEGTLAAQRIIIGAAVLFGLYLYLGELTRLQCNWYGFSLTSGTEAITLDSLLGGSRNSMNALALAHLFDFLVLPIAYTRLKNFGLGRFNAILAAMLTSLLLGAVLSQAVALAYGIPSPFFNGNFVARLVAGGWLAALLAIYLSKIEVDVRSGSKSPLDILFAFVGSYGRSKELEANLREWTDRYRLVLENAGEMIVMLSRDGRILDANYSAARLLGSENPGELTNRMLFPRMRILDRPELKLGGELDSPVRFQCRLDENLPTGKLLSCSLSPIRARGQLLLVLIGRDVTEESRLAEEKARLAEQLVHSQRIEALGMLAGGIAHDFNNYIHAILGHVDVINFLHQPDNPEVVDHLEKISTIAEQAGNLTSQLLGFARKGKYQVTDLDLKQVLGNSLGLLGPRKQRDLSVSVEVPADLGPVRADALQLQQVMLNLMINAIDAMEGNPGEQILTIAAGPAADSPVPLEPPQERGKVDPADYLYIRVSDNGSGMSGETRKKLFEPFFTTKPVGQGTGMGLAMVYGIITNHQGWIQLESEPGRGTSFYLFLPFGGRGEAKG
ncbi:MAG: PAS domain S-box protein [Lentisphaeria bacterium]|nr:PAS domain S-box protein [Lentisphaeria bacterium]